MEFAEESKHKENLEIFTAKIELVLQLSLSKSMIFKFKLIKVYLIYEHQVLQMKNKRTDPTR